MRLVWWLLGILIGLPAVLLASGAVATLVLTARADRQFPPQGEFKTVEGTRIHLLAAGQGRPVVLLHGANGAVQDWTASIFEPLSRKYRVIAMDRPGHGYSERPTGGGVVTPEVQARLIRGALQQIGVEKPILVAFSWSGSLALAYALAWPDEVAGVVMLAGAAYPWPTPVSPIYRLPNVPVIGPLFAHTLAMPVATLLIDGFVHGAFAPSPVAGNFGKAGLALALRPGSYRANAEDVYYMKPFLLAQSERYGTLKPPIAILHGDSDGVVGLEIHSRALAAAAPHATLEVVPGAGHLLHHIVPDRVLATIDAMAARTR